MKPCIQRPATSVMINVAIKAYVAIRYEVTESTAVVTARCSLYFFGELSHTLS